MLKIPKILRHKRMQRRIIWLTELSLREFPGAETNNSGLPCLRPSSLAATDTTVSSAGEADWKKGEDAVSVLLEELLFPDGDSALGLTLLLSPTPTPRIASIIR
jgi:hypothetical protein